jgi:hypothetical protein
VSYQEGFSVNTQYTATGNSPTSRLKVCGPPWGGTITITAVLTSNLTNTDFINVVQAGAAAWTGTGKTDTFTGWTSQAIGA